MGGGDGGGMPCHPKPLSTPSGTLEGGVGVERESIDGFPNLSHVVNFLLALVRNLLFAHNRIISLVFTHVTSGTPVPLSASPTQTGSLQHHSSPDPHSFGPTPLIRHKKRMHVGKVNKKMNHFTAISHYPSLVFGNPACWKVQDIECKKSKRGVYGGGFAQHWTFCSCGEPRMVESRQPCCGPRAQGRSGIEVDNEQGDKLELWRSYHPEPLGHTALLVVTDSLIITKTHSATRVVEVEGRDSYFLSGPNLKKGQIQSNINHCALHSFPSTIVIEQTNGKRPVAGGNKKPFDNYRTMMDWPWEVFRVAGWGTKQAPTHCVGCLKSPKKGKS
eukprot:superscaffoldBa00000044_g784